VARTAGGERPLTQTTPTRPPRGDPAPGWSHCLASGAPGIALLHIEYARASSGKWYTAHQWAAAMTRSPVPAHPGACSLYFGAPAVAFTLHAAGQPAYTKALNTLDSHIATLTRRRLGQAHQRIGSGRLPALHEFDLISGLTGIGAYLLYRHGGADLLGEVLSYLVRLTQPLTIHGEALPGWWCGTGPSGHPSPRWPGGHANLGVAHGISGPLALLSTAMRRGVTVTGQAEAIGRICAWLDQWHAGEGKRAWWPEMISLPESRSHVARQAGPGRPSWCYGTPGLARAQQLAGLALADAKRRRLAEQALAGCLADHEQLSQLGDTSLCHGWAGLVQTTWRAASDAGPDTELTARLPDLRAKLGEHLQRHSPDQAGFLEGMAGVLLAQHATVAGDAPATRWDACLLLGG
jgi:class I lanthipeptide synthase